VQSTPPGRIDEIVRAVAQVQPLWALLRVEDRARYMRRMAQAIIDEFDALAQAIGREQGRPRAEVAALELLPRSTRWSGSPMTGEGARRAPRRDPPLDVARAARAGRV